MDKEELLSRLEELSRITSKLNTKVTSLLNEYKLLFK